MTLFFSVSSLNVFGQAGKNYQHWADGDAATGSAASWNNNILSANKSDYFEGEVIPHVAVLPASNNAPLEQNHTYTFTVVYNFWQSNTNAGGFAFITTYNISRQPTPFGTVTPAPDPNGFTGTGNQGVFFVGHGVDVISAAAPSTTTASRTKDQTVLITFKWTDPTTTSGSALIFYGLYIAEPGKVPDQGKGTTKGAHAWTGGSLQTTLNSSFTGGLSLQLAPSAIIVGSISGVKFKDLDKDGIKDAGEPLLSGWTIQLDNDTDPNNGILQSQVTDANGAYSFSVTPDANKNTAGNDPYIVREVLQSGWTQTLPATGFYSVTISALTPTSTGNDFGNFLCENPTISASIGNICAGTTSATVTYTATNSPNQYKIDWDATAEAAGLTDIAYTSLPASPFNITVPGTLAAGTYNGTISVKTSLGCESAGSAISLTVNGNPTASAGDAPAAQCQDAVNGNTFSLSGSGSNGTPSWAVQSNPNGLTVTFIPNPPNTFTPQVKITGGTGTVTLRLTVTSDKTPSCGSTTSDITVTVNPNPTADAGTAPAAQCSDAVNGNTFSLSGSGSNGTPSWAVQSNLNGLTVTFIPNPPNTFTPQVKITGGTGTVTLRLTVTSDANPSCGTATSDVTVTVNDHPAAPDAEMVTPLCTDKTFKVVVHNSVVGVTYTATQPLNSNPYSSSKPGNGGDITFTGLTFGDGFSVTASNDASGCTSGATTCDGSSSLISTSQQSSGISTQSLKTESPKVLAAPNPFNDKIRFSFQSPVSGKGTLELYTLMGQKVKTVFEGFVQKGQVQTIDYSVPASQRTNLIYIFRIGNFKTSSMLIGLK